MAQLTKEEKLAKLRRIAEDKAYREAYEKAYNKQMKILIEAEKRMVPPPKMLQ